MPIIIQRRAANQVNPNLPMLGGVMPGFQDTPSPVNTPPPPTTGGMKIQPRTDDGTEDDGVQFVKPFRTPQQPTPQPTTPEQMNAAAVPEIPQQPIANNPGIMTRDKMTPQNVPLPVTKPNPYQQLPQQPTQPVSPTMSGTVNQPQAPMTDEQRLAQLQAQENDLVGTDPKDKNGRLKSFLYALASGLSNFQMIPNARGQFGWGQLAASLAPVLGEGVGGLVNPSIDERMKRDRDLAKNRAQQQTFSSRIDANNKRYDEQMKRQKGAADLQGQLYSNLDKEQKLLYDAANSDNVITEEEAQMLREKTRLPFQASDKRKFSIEDRNGVSFAVNQEGMPNPTPIRKMPLDEKNTRRTVTYGDGSKADLTNSEFNQLKTAEASRNAQSEQAANLQNNRNEKEFEDDEQAYNAKMSNLKGKAQAASKRSKDIDTDITAAQGDIDELKAKKKQLDDTPDEEGVNDKAKEQIRLELREARGRLADLKKEKRSADSDATSAQTELSEMENKKPKKTPDVKPVKSQTTTTKQPITPIDIPKMTEADFRARNAKLKKPLSEAELKRAIATARAKGRITD